MSALGQRPDDGLPTRAEVAGGLTNGRFWEVAMAGQAAGLGRMREDRLGWSGDGPLLPHNTAEALIRLPVVEFEP
jgi:hypothetical protein